MNNLGWALPTTIYFDRTKEGRASFTEKNGRDAHPTRIKIFLQAYTTHCYKVVLTSTWDKRDEKQCIVKQN
uniref:Uncharacterized protein n=1 Tax=Tolypothrix bouteillei VB521301 TaxID=1479485 RepID=A0A0C1RM52_9CYAN